MKIALTSDTHAGLDGRTEAKHYKFWKKLGAVPGVDLMIHAGDWATNRQRQISKSMETLRKHISWPIACVFGNHDYWRDKEDGEDYGIGEIMALHTMACDKYKIHYLETGPLIIGDHIILGFDSWYRTWNPPTNDKNWMPIFHEGVPVHTWMGHRASQSLDRLLLTDTEAYRKVVCVTHFPPYTHDRDYEEFCAPAKYLNFLTEKADILCMGHSHKLDIQVINDCQMLNSGADYNRPRALIFDTETMKVDRMVM